MGCRWKTCFTTAVSISYREPVLWCLEHLLFLHFLLTWVFAVVSHTPLSALSCCRVVFDLFSKRFSQRHHQCHWWIQLWSAVALLELAVSSTGQSLASSPRSFLQPPATKTMPHKPNTEVNFFTISTYTTFDLNTK